MEPKRLYRIQEGRRICGVCLGVAEYLNVDVTVVRLVWLVAALGGCSLGFWAYLIFALVLPEKTYWGQ